MTSKTPKSFVESTALDAPDLTDVQMHTRRLATYSVSALRIANTVEGIFVNHPSFASGLKALDRLFQLGTELSTPQGLRLIGPPGAGKTALFQYFRNSLPSSALFANSMGAIGLRVPKRPLSGLFVRDLLQVLRYPFSGGSYKQLYERRQLAFEALEANGTRMIWLDEAHHLLTRHTSKLLNGDEHEGLEFFRELQDRCRISLILAGSAELDNLPAYAPQFLSRVVGREALETFSLDVNWLGFLKAFAGQSSSINIGLINEPSYGALLHKATGGNLRAFKQLMVEAVLVAHDSGKSAVQRDSLHQAFVLVFGRATTKSNPFA